MEHCELTDLPSAHWKYLLLLRLLVLHFSAFIIKAFKPNTPDSAFKIDNQMKAEE